MHATEVLMNEHRQIERVVEALFIAAERIANGEEMRPSFFISAALFIKNYADGCHHKKEEDILFVAMQEAGVPVEGGPIGVMLAEHQQGRLFNAEMRDAAQKWETGDLSARSAVAQNALGYVTLLRQHIRKEDMILFPMAGRVINPQKQEDVTHMFEQVRMEEERMGVPEKYIALAEVLEKESQKKL